MLKFLKKNQNLIPNISYTKFYVESHDFQLYFLVTINYLNKIRFLHWSIRCNRRETDENSHINLIIFNISQFDG